MAKAKKTKKSKAKKSRATAKTKKARKTRATASASRGKAKKSAGTAKRTAPRASASKATRNTPPKKRQIVGEGDYQASRSFLKDQSNFVARHSADIPAMGKAAEAALEGSEGGELRAAEEKALGRSRAIGE